MSHALSADKQKNLATFRQMSLKAAKRQSGKVAMPVDREQNKEVEEVEGKYHFVSVCFLRNKAGNSLILKSWHTN
ncbi:hypothetical protein [Vibrio vulnificus]|uniref:hypothetical protein n=1 Tax=Vibrio vulnificus TaxID=672 RepID=UPI0021115FB8|nr:hypothetical protein [Vibrio vulnificus]ELV8643447.1 hypothetical protein [Vibrio vulnificus]HBH7893517.1 hypothetical protein [Vibrio vulnificus]